MSPHCVGPGQAARSRGDQCGAKKGTNVAGVVDGKFRKFDKRKFVMFH